MNKGNKPNPSKSGEQNTFGGRARANSAISTGITECDIANIKAHGGKIVHFYFVTVSS